MLKSQLPEAMANSWGKQWNNQKALKKNLGNKMFTGDFEKLWHVPGKLKGHMHVWVCACPKDVCILWKDL